MKKMIFLLLFTAITVFSQKLTIDFSHIDPLTSAVFKGVEKAFEINEKGLASMEIGDFEAAEIFFKEADEMIPIYSDAKNNLGVLYFRTERIEEAEELWEKVVEQDPEYAIAWYNLGLTAINFGEKDKAIENFSRAIKEQSDFGRAKVQLAKIYLLDAKPNEAKKLAAEAYAKTPDDSEIWPLYAYILVSVGDTTQAIKMLEKKVPSEIAVLMLGQIYAVKGEVGKAKTYLESLRVSGSENRDYYETLAAVYNELKMFKKTEELFIEAENLGDDISLSFWVTFAWAVFELGEADRAVAVMWQKSAENPDDKNLKATLIYFLISSNKFAEAKKVLDDFGDIENNNFHLEYLKGFAALNSKQFTESKKALEAALKISPNDNNAKGLLAFVLMNLGDEKRAEKLWREAGKSDTQNNQSLINLGVLAEKRNQPDTALSYFKQALKISENAGVRVSIGNIYLEKKQFDSALVSFAFVQDSTEWRTKAFSGMYFAALGLKDSLYADKIAAFLAVSDTGDVVIRVLSDHAYRHKDFINAEKLSRSISKPIAEDYLRLGWIYLAIKNTKSAEAAIDSAKNLQADENEIAKLQQQIAFIKGDHDSALNFKDNSPAGIYNRAIILYRNKNFQEALNSAMLAADMFSGSEKIEMVRIAANSAAAIKNWAAALRWFSLLNKLDPTPLNALNVAIAAYNENNITLTKEFYLSAKNQDSTIYNKDIETRLEEEETPAEIQQITVMSSVDSMYNQALNLHLAGNIDSAIVLYQKLLEVEKNYYRAWNNLGAIYGERGEIEEAVLAYENAVSRRADIVDGYVNLVNLYSAIDDKSNAKKWLRRGLRIAPDDENLLFFKKQLEE